MLYLYTLMMFAWDLDPDTHSYFREYLDVFINKRKISKDLRGFLDKTRSRAITWHGRPDINLPSNNFNELRFGLPYRVVVLLHTWPDPTIIRSNKVHYNRRHGVVAIEKIHPPKYHHNARKISAPSRPHTNP